MRCTSCEFENPDGMKFCGGCGAELSLACAGCGASNPPDFRFCGSCGRSLQALEDPVAPVAPRATGPAATPERRHLTVMFCDLVDSTVLSEALDPEDLRDVIRDYQRIAVAAIERYDGYVAQYLGDGVLVYFGYPRAREDDAQRAVIAGLEALEGIGDLNRRTEGVRIAARIGVHSGEVVAGEMGSGNRSEALAVGDTPNIASRLQGVAQPGELVISERTRLLVRRHVSATDLGRQTLNGIAKPVGAFRVDAFVETPATLGVAHLVGREAELATLAATRRRAFDGNARLTTLIGEPGVGKSALLSAFRAQHDDPWLLVQCSSMHQASALYPLRAPIADLYNNWLHTAPPAWVERFLNAGAVQEQVPELIERFTELILDLPARLGAVVVFEDLHWADQSTLDLIGLLSARLAVARKVFLCTSRPGIETPWLGQSSILQIEALPDDDALALVERLGEGRLPTPVCRKIVERAGGVPLLVEALTETVLRSQLDGQSVDDLVGMIPESLRDALEARLDRLDDAKPTLQVASLLGRRVDVALVSAVSGVELEPTRRALAQASQEGLMDVSAASGSEYEFRHALIQDAAYASMLRSQCRELHGRAADILADQYADLVSLHPETLARHLEGAHRHDEAFDSYVQAGRTSFERKANVESLQMFSKAETLLGAVDETVRDGKEINLQLLMGGPRRELGGYAHPDLRRSSERIMELASSKANAALLVSALVEMWGTAVTSGDEQRTVHAAAELARATRGNNKKRVLAAVRFSSGSTRFYQGRFARSLKALSESMQAYEPDDVYTLLRDDGMYLVTVCVHAYCIALMGQPSRALEMLADKLAVCEGRPTQFAEVQLLAHSNAIHEHNESPTEWVAECHRRIVAITDRSDMARWTGGADIALSWARSRDGDVGGPDALADAMHRTYRIGEVSRGHHLAMLAESLIMLGRLDEADSVLVRALDETRANLGKYAFADFYRVRGRLAEARGDLVGARQEYRQAFAVAERQRAGLFRLRALTALTRVSDATERAANESRLRAELEVFDDGVNSPLRRHALTVLDG